MKKNAILFLIFFTGIILTNYATGQILEGVSQPIKVNIKKPNRAIEDPIIVDEIPTGVERLNIIGKYYALIIGINEYPNPGLNSLNRPVLDAQNLAKTLVDLYTFDSKNVKLLLNPNREGIIEALDNLVDKVGVEDNLLIFYAGHGKYDKIFDEGYWLASNAKRNTKGDWIENSTLTKYLNAIRSKHTLLIADACYAGALFRNVNVIEAEISDDLYALHNKTSRKAMTSGAIEAVPDNSIFIKYLLEGFRNNREKIIKSGDLFISVNNSIQKYTRGKQTPQYSHIANTGHSGGEFLFIRRNKQ